MAALALGAIGAQLGAGYAGFLGVTGAQIGWMVGSTLGSLLGQKAVHTVQPGIGDRSVQASTYGSYKTVIYGTMRVAGNVIDGVGEVREVLTTTRVGKGGPKGSNTTRSWNADVAIDLGQAGLLGIRKMWLAGKVVYDVSTGASASSIIASSARAQSVKIYDGSETQLPDPTLETLHGAGNVPAYRGRSYIVFAGMDCPNGQIPQLSFEVSYAIAASATLPALTPAVPLNPETLYETAIYTSISRVCGPDVIYHMTANSGGGGIHGNQWSAQGYRAGNGYVQKIWTAVLGDYGTGNYSRLVGANGSHKTPFSLRSALALNGTYGTTNTLVHIDLLTGIETTIRTFVPGTIANDLVVTDAAYDEISEQFIVIGDGSGGRTYEKSNPGIYTKTGGLILRLATLNAGVGYPVAFYNSIVYVIDIRSGLAYLQSYNASTGAYIDEVGPGPASLDVTSEPGAVDSGSGVTVIGRLTQISAHAGGVFVYSKSLSKSWRIDSGGWFEISNTVPNSASPGQGVANSWVEADYVVEGPITSGVDALVTYRVAAHKSFDPADVTLASVVSDICLNAGLTAGQIDVTALSVDTLRGYAITRQSSARAALEPLLKAFFIDVREQDGKVQFIRRADQVSSFDIGYDELASYEAGGDAPDPMPLSRTDELQLPRSVSVSYIDYAADYQTGTQVARRQTVETANDQSDDLAIATTASRAATVAEVLLYDAWSQRNKRTATVQRKFAAVSPGDVGTIEYPRGTFTQKRVTRTNDTGVLVQLDLVDADAPLYGNTTPGAEMPAGQAGPTLVPPAKMALLDLPLLRDADATSNGIIAALAGYTTPWSGGVLYEGKSEATLAIAGSVTSGANIGMATTALAAWSQNTVDWLNTVTVEDVGTALSSCTLDAALDDGQNACVIGDEVLQFLTATYVSAGKYVLSNLIRGQRGTERHRATHAAFEQFVMLSAAGTGMIDLAQDLGEIGQAHLYRAISYGLSADSAASVSFTSQGVRLKPLSPVNFKREALNGNSSMTWDRRSRLSGDFVDNGDIALGETSELYYVDIYSDNTYSLIVRTIQTNTPSCIYTLAQQTTDWGGYRPQLYLRISQVSALVGRGFALEVDSNVANVNSTPPSLLAHMDGAGSITVPVDSSAYAFAGAIVGSGALSATQSKFGGSSLYVPGVVGVEHGATFATSSAAFNVGTGDFTLEYWFYPVAATSNVGCFAIEKAGVIAAAADVLLYMQMNQSTGAMTVTTNYSASFDATITSAGGSFTIGAWNHCAVTRKSGTLYLFINGVLRGSAASVNSLNYTAGFLLKVGFRNVTSSATTYYDEIRFLKGEAYYFTDFTPPAAPF
mgnify:CR=1 FL=1